MSMDDKHSTRRAFFLQGGAALGTGVAATAGAALAQPAAAGLSVEPSLAEDREAIRRLHVAFTAHVQSGRYEAAAALFDEHAELALGEARASGRREIERVFAEQYRGQRGDALHSAYRQNALQQRDTVSVGADRVHASATFHGEVELSTPLRDDCTIAEMARLQGHVADRRWEAGRFDAKYVKSAGEWKVAALRWTGNVPAQA